MAWIDATSGNAVVRIVYDGPPLSGKTETLKALGRELHGSDRREHAPWTPDQAQGRTLYFDWLEYLGGRFQGRPVYCQIVAVPGQEALVQRRRHIVETADALVFVLDASAADPGPAQRAFRQSQGWLAAAGGPVGVVIQANKQDLAADFSRDRLLESLGDLPQLTVVPTSAAQGRGVREGFVTAVGLAMDRIRDQAARGTLESVDREQLSGSELLAGMSAVADAVLPPAPPPVAPPPAPRKLRHSGPPPLPQADADGELLWPPVQARALIHELGQEQPGETIRDGAHWRARAGARWQLLAGCEPLAGYRETALERLRQISQAHAGLRTWTSVHRCLALVEHGDGWHLWQVLRGGINLDYLLRRILHSDSIEFLARDLFLMARDLRHLLATADHRWMLNEPDLVDFRRWQEGCVFGGFLRWDAPDRSASKPDPDDWLRRLVEAHLHAYEPPPGVEIPQLLEALKGQASDPDESAVADALRAMLIGH